MSSAIINAVDLNYAVEALVHMWHRGFIRHNWRVMGGYGLLWCVCTGLFKSSAEETDADVNKTCKQAKINSSDKTELMRMRMMKIVMAMMEIMMVDGWGRQWWWWWWLWFDDAEDEDNDGDVMMRTMMLMKMMMTMKIMTMIYRWGSTSAIMFFFSFDLYLLFKEWNNFSSFLDEGKLNLIIDF